MPKRVVVCKRCNRLRPYYAKGMCNSCYQYVSINNRPKKTCKRCGELKVLKIRGMCDTCYYRLKYQNNPTYREKHKKRVGEWYKKPENSLRLNARRYFKSLKGVNPDLADKIRKQI